MDRIGESADIIDGAEYEKTCTKQTQDYKELVDSLTKG
jgi:hypothetical protein